MLRNSNELFVHQCTSRKFLDILEDVLTSTRTSPVVRERLLDVLAAAAYASSSRKCFPIHPAPPHPSLLANPGTVRIVLLDLHAVQASASNYRDLHSHAKVTRLPKSLYAVNDANALDPCFSFPGLVRFDRTRHLTHLDPCRDRREGNPQRCLSRAVEKGEASREAR